jgi:hypothetical protein
MITRFIMTNILVLLSICAFAQSKKQIKALKIKSTTENVTVYEGGTEKATWKSSYQAFDKEGNTIEEITYNRDGSVQRKETAKYSGKNKVEETTLDNGKKDDGDNDSGRKYKKVTYKYNGNGDKTEEVLYDEKGVVIKKITYAYNSAGDKVFEMEYDASGVQTKKTVYGYNGKGLRIDKKVYGPGDVLLKQVKYIYTF